MVPCNAHCRSGCDIHSDGAHFAYIDHRPDEHVARYRHNTVLHYIIVSVGSENTAEHCAGSATLKCRTYIELVGCLRPQLRRAGCSVIRIGKSRHPEYILIGQAQKQQPFLPWPQRKRDRWRQTRGIASETVVVVAQKQTRNCQDRASAIAA